MASIPLTLVVQHSKGLWRQYSISIENKSDGRWYAHVTAFLMATSKPPKGHIYPPQSGEHVHNGYYGNIENAVLAVMGAIDRDKIKRSGHAG